MANVQEKLKSLKKELKDWEAKFFETEKRNPSKVLLK